MCLMARVKMFALNATLFAPDANFITPGAINPPQLSHV
jgi:hypothetical protein